MSIENEKLPMDLVGKYLSGAATPEEAMELHALLDDIEAREEFDKVSRLWHQSLPGTGIKTVSSEEAWIEFEQLVKKKNKPATIKLLLNRYAVAASVVTIILIAAWFVFQGSKTSTSNLEHHSASNISADTLQDGSVAILNTNSTIFYPGTFDKKARTVTLKGEAFFEVAPDKQRPFQITVDDVTIKVVGTSFNIRKVRGDTVIEVQVRSGVVQMFTDDAKINVGKGQTGSYNHFNKTLVVQDTIDANSYGYATKQFLFNNTAFTKTCKYLEKGFNVQINLEAGVFDNCHITAEFDNKPLKYILEVLCTTLNATYTIKGNTISIKGTTRNKLCGEQPFLQSQ